MGIKLYREPKLQNADMIASWPGIGNIGLIAVDTLRSQLQAEELAEIEPWDFFYPKKVTIKGGVLEDLQFPGSKFYYKKLEGKDLLLFLGEEQPTGPGEMYAAGKKAYEMANLVLDVAERFGCRRVYTSGAAVSLIHHAVKPRVWAVASTENLIKELKSYDNIILMSEIEGRSDQGTITGLNGLLLGVAKKRNFEAVCLMGEIPDYLSRAPFVYPRASKSIVEILAKILGLSIDFSTLDGMAAQIDSIINGIYEKFPPEIRERIDQRKSVAQTKGDTISEEDGRWIKEHINEFFKRGHGGSERAT